VFSELVFVFRNMSQGNRNDITGYPSMCRPVRMLTPDETRRMLVAHQKWLAISQMPDGFAGKPYYGRVVQGRFLWATRQEPDLKFEETNINGRGIVSVDGYFSNGERTGTTYILGELRMRDRAFLRYNPAFGPQSAAERFPEFLFFGTDGMIQFP